MKFRPGRTGSTRCEMAAAGAEGKATRICLGLLDHKRDRVGGFARRTASAIWPGRARTAGVSYGNGHSAGGGDGCGGDSGSELVAGHECGRGASAVPIHDCIARKAAAVNCQGECWATNMRVVWRQFCNFGNNSRLRSAVFVRTVSARSTLYHEPEHTNCFHDATHFSRKRNKGQRNRMSANCHFHVKGNDYSRCSAVECLPQ
jgi:hypothetical protein